MVCRPDEVSDGQGILISAIFPTGSFGADLAGGGVGATVAVFGAGPVGVFAVVSAFLHGAGRVICVDQHTDRLAMARRAGAETVDFSAEDPIDAIRELTGGIGPDRAIDAVGVEAEQPGSPRTETSAEEFQEETDEVAPEQDDEFQPGGAPSMGLRWAGRSPAKAGRVG